MSKYDGEIVVCPDRDALARAGTERIVSAARESIAARGRFLLALAGGSTPERMYRLLAGPDYAHRIDWTRTYVFFGDERFVPRDDEQRSNYAMAKRALLDHVPVSPDRVFPVDTSLPTAEDAARSYAETLTKIMGEPPVSDLILLGLGDDGHTASLFPHAAALTHTDALAVASPPGTLPPPVERITLTFPVLNAARSVLFLVSGDAKAEAARDVLEGDAGVEDRPAAGVHPTGTPPVWLLDRAAARLLKSATR